MQVRIFIINTESVLDIFFIKSKVQRNEAESYLRYMMEDMSLLGAALISVNIIIGAISSPEIVFFYLLVR